MAEIKVHSKQLERFTALYAFVSATAYNSLLGFDTDGKMEASYFAKKILKLDDGVLSTFYRCNVAYMRNKWEDVIIQMELDDNLLLRFHQVQRLWILATDDELQIKF